MNKRKKKKIDKMVDKVLKLPPESLFLSGAQRHKTDPKTNAALPSDEAVEEMRDYSIENKL